jgi:hypothetical protein
VRILAALAIVALAALAGDSDRAAAMITVGAGAHAGDFIVRNADDPCAITEQKAPHPKHQFQVSIGGPMPKIDSTKLSLLMMIVPNADIRGPNRSFFSSITFGDIAHGTQYIVETRPGEKLGGSGTVVVSPHGQDATVTFNVTSMDGVSYKGTIQCSGVSHD